MNPQGPRSAPEIKRSSFCLFAGSFSARTTPAVRPRRDASALNRSPDLEGEGRHSKLFGAWLRASVNRASQSCFSLGAKAN